MSYYVDLLVCFPCFGGCGIQRLAQQHLPAIASAAEAELELGSDYHLHHRYSEAQALLAYMAEGHGVAGGPKGSMFSWGIVGNYTDGAAFVEALRPFWEDLLSAGDGRGLADWDGPHSYAAVLVLHQGEADASPLVAQITRADPNRPWRRDVVVRQGSVPFGFGRDQGEPLPTPG